MKIIFMGTPDFAVPCLEQLVEEKYDVIGVFTQTDKPKGRGKKLSISPVKEKALAYGLNIYQPDTLKKPETVELIKELNPDLIVVAAYGQILPKSVLEIPPLGCINVHGSLLPKYRGAAPIQWAVINGEEKTGITTMYMDAGLDTGDMLLKEELIIGKDETTEELYERMAVLGAQTLMKTLKQIQEGTVKREKQKDEEATFAPRLTKELGQIQWHKSAEEINNLIRGTIPWPTAYTYYDNKIMKVLKSRVKKSQADHMPGQILEVSKEGIEVAAGKDILIIEELQFSGGKRLKVKDYLVGNTMEKNIILGDS